MISRITRCDYAILTFAGITAILFIPMPTFVTSSAFGQESGNMTNDNSQTKYESSYSIETSGATRPLTIGTEHHLYHPGETIRVGGSVWADLVEKVENLDLVKIELKDGMGNIVAREEANVSASNGEYSTSLRLLDSAGKGLYTVSTNVEVDADALGIINTITSAALQSSIEIAVAPPEEHKVDAENQEFTVTIASNSGISNFNFNQQDKKISFFVEGDSGTTGITEITIPKRLLSVDMSVFVDQNLVAKEDVLLKSDSETETTFEINYHHSIHRVEVAGTNVVPEFPLATLVMAGSIASVIALFAIMTKRVHTTQ